MRDEVDELLAPCAAALRLLGMWGVATRRGVFVLLLNLAGTACAAVTLAFQPPRDLERLAMTAYVCAQGTLLSVKVAAFLWHRKRLRQLALQLVSCWRQFEDVGGGVRAIYRRQAVRVVRYMQVMTGIPTMMWMLEPLFSGGEDSPQGRSLPLPTWLPDALQQSPTYELLYVLQVFTIVVAIAVSVYLNIFFAVLMLSIAAELHVLNNNMMAMGKFGDNETAEPYKRDEGVHRDRVTSSLLSSYRRPRGKLVAAGHSLPGPVAVYTQNGSHEQMYHQLIKNIRHHQVILRSVAELQKAMTHSIFVLLFLNMLNICVVIFAGSTLLQKQADQVAMYKMLFSVPIYMYETGFFCVVGQTIIDQGERLSMSAFASAWLDSPRKLHRLLLVFMLRCARPPTITVGKTYTLSKRTFLRILNGSYTMFNMLYQFQRKR
ncbi:odorant receptor 43a-like [Schistocerca cancellata]|uniref:odorant receptor 43a-like n=2 Tax=Schistocerca TaxID=7008 RepID=UPI002118E5D6|nr:odorant receptor 43a-like [Schistocerca cancellata]